MITVLDKNTALVLIDLQKSIVQLPLAKPVSDILKNAARLANAFHKASLPVVIVNVNSVGAAWTKVRKDSGPLRNITFKEDWLEITPEITIKPGDIFITKHTWNAFYET